MKNKKTINYDGIKTAVLLSMAMSFMLCVFEPLSMYFLNKKDYWFDFYTMMPACIIVSAVIFIVLSAVTSLLAVFLPKIYKIIMPFYFALFACLYIQGNFMIKDLPALDGSAIQWSDYTRQMLYSGIMWISVTAVTAVLSFTLLKKVFSKIVQFVAVCMTLMFIVTGITVGISNDGFEKKDEVTFTTQYKWDYSDDTNYIILVLDAVDGTEESEVLDNHPEYTEALKDFTYYDNVMSGYTYTYFAMPFLLSGEWFEYQESYDDWNERAYTQSGIITALKEQGYRLGMYDESAPRYGDEMFQYENVVADRGKIGNIVDFAKVELRMVGFKYLPYVLKWTSQVLPSEIDALEKNADDIERVYFYGTNIEFYQECSEQGINVSEQKCFKLIHLEGAHVPLIYNADVTTSEVTSYTGNVEASNTVLAAYIDRLKEEGIYDNSVIIVMSDHGFNRELGNVPDGRQHAILFVKGINEHHDSMQTDSAPISQADFQEAYLKLLDGADSTEIFGWKEGDIRQRRYLFNYHDEPGERILYEFVDSGDCTDTENIERTGNFYYFSD
jgi:hypothetical protein